ncbi:MAG: hypothetical protein ACREYE_01280 [Gammaproteobacteria bacterium]
MSARWDRFSWFGLLPVSDKGEIGSLPETYGAAKLIPALEAILIEALEPRQNRKRGDDLAAVEYLQKVDPEIEKKKVKATLDAALNTIKMSNKTLQPTAQPLRGFASADLMTWTPPTLTASDVPE